MFIPYLPTPEEIAEECRKIRATWSEEEEINRRAPAYRPKPIEFDTVARAADTPATSKLKRHFVAEALSVSNRIQDV